MSRAYQQGQADGLCGLYCILNFLVTLDDWKNEKPAKAMEYVLEAVHAEGVLAPYWITGGYRSTELKAILNRIFDKWLMPYEALYLEEIARQDNEDVYSLHQRVLNKSCAIIGRSNGGDHWRLFDNIKRKKLIVDSASPARPTRSFDGRSKTLCSEDSLVIRKKERAVIDIGS